MTVFPKHLKVKVTQENIDKGMRMNAMACPIHRALRPDYEDYSPVVMYDMIQMKAPFGIALYEPSKKCSKFIDHFDAGKPVKPATFILTRID